MTLRRRPFAVLATVIAMFSAVPPLAAVADDGDPLLQGLTDGSDGAGDVPLEPTRVDVEDAFRAGLLRRHSDLI